jgi:transcriptional regulator with XRE-family HTH domain
MALRLARQARGFSQQQLAGMAGVSRQAVSAVESGLSDPSLRVALALARALGMTVEQLFGPGSPVSPVAARSVAPLGDEGARVTLAPMGDEFVALPLSGDLVSRAGFLPADGLAADGLVHVAGAHLRGRSRDYNTGPAGDLLPQGAEVIGFCSWREGLVLRPEHVATLPPAPAGRRRATPRMNSG